MGIELNRTGIAQVLGVSMNTVSDWVERGMPVVQRGSRGVPWTFDAAACVRWQLDYELANAKGEESKDVTLDDAIRRSTIADAILKELKVAEQRRSVVKIEDVARIWEGRIIAARETFLGISQRIAPLIVGESDQARIEEQIDLEVRRALEELAEGRPSEDDADDESDADDD